MEAKLVRHSSHWGSFSAEVRDGRVTGIRAFEGDPDPSRLINAIPDIVHSPLRIERPHVRKGWLTRGATGHDPNRGAEPFVPMEWDDVLDLVAAELTRVRERHGATSIFGGSAGWSSAGRFHHAQTHVRRFLGHAGGFTSQVTNYSYGAGMTILRHVVGNIDSVSGPITSWPDICRNARLFVAFGGLSEKNWQISSGGFGAHSSAHWLREAERTGLRIVVLSPLQQDCPAGAHIEWIKIRPNSDTALMLAIAHVLIESGRCDRSFLERYTVGFERLSAYILGQPDGIAKSPDWAAPLTGIPAAVIRALAQDMADQPTMLTASWSLQRADHGEQPYWMLVALAAMLGQIGLPGTGFGFGYGSINGRGNSRIGSPSLSLSSGVNPAGLAIPAARLTEMLERPGGSCDFDGRVVHFPDVRLIYWAGGNPFHHHQDLNRLLRAWAKPETIIVHEPWWTPVARHADIVLPATTTLERNDIGCNGRDRFIVAMPQVIAPLAQARSDYAIFSALAQRLGIAAAYTEQRGEMEWLAHLYEVQRRQVLRWGVELPPFETFWAQGFVELAAPEPGQELVLLKDFRDDPQKYPLRTPTGRIELFSQAIADFHYDDCPGHPAWLAPKEWLGSPRAAIYPLHLLTFQPGTRLHSQLDHARISRDSKVQGREPVFVHSADAAERGISDGDVVRLFNDRGECLAGARLTEGILRQVVGMATGAWLDLEEPGIAGSLEVHGNPNVLTRDEGTSKLSQGPSAQSCLVEMELWTKPLPPIKAHQPPRIESE